MHLRVLSALLLSAMAGACAHPAIRDLSVSPPQAPRPSRGCVLSVSAVADERPSIEREGGKQTSLTFLFPLPWVWIQRSAGFRLHSVDTIGGERLLSDLRAGIIASVEASGLCRIAEPGASATHELEVRLQHLYGVGYTRSAFKEILFVYVTNDIQAFLPAGQLSLQLVLKKGAAQRTIKLSAQAISDPSLDGSPQYADTEDQSSAVVARAVAEGYAALPTELERALAELDGPRGAPSPKRFRIARLSDDYGFVELADIDAETGVVIEDRVVERRGATYAEPGEWVLALEQPEVLARPDYLALVSALSARWDVRFEGNLTAARFFGPRGPMGGSDTPAPASPRGTPRGSP